MRNWKKLRAFQSRTEAAIWFISSTSLPFPFHSSPAIFFLTAGSAAQPGQTRPSWARAAATHLPLLLLPGRVQEQVPVPVVLLLHVGLRPADRGLVVGSVIIYHVSKRNLSAPQRNYQGWKGAKIKRGEKKNDNGPKQRDGMGKVQDPGKWSSFLAAFSSKWAAKVRNIRRVQSENPRSRCEKKSSQSELRGCWEEPAAPTRC